MRSTWDARSVKRKERREAVLMLLIGAMFAAIGLLLWLAAGRPWIGALGIVFGTMSMFHGVIVLSHFRARTVRLLYIVMSFMFGSVGALMIVISVLVPGAWGWRGAAFPAVMGAVAVVFFFGGGVLLVIREIKLRKDGR